MLINKTDFSGVASVSLDNVFTATYDTYRIIISNMSQSGGNFWNLRLRVAGVDNSSNNWTSARYEINTGGAAQAGGIGTELPMFNPVSAVTSGLVEMVVSRPALADMTEVFGNAGGIFGTNPRTIPFGGVHAVATAYDGFTIFPSAGTISGTVRVYGMSNTPGVAGAGPTGPAGATGGAGPTGPGGTVGPTGPAGSGTVVEEWDFESTSDGANISTIADLFGATTGIATLANTRYEFEVEAWYTRTTAGTVTFTLAHTTNYTRLNAQLWHSPAAGSAQATSLNTSAIEGAAGAGASLPATATQTLNTGQHALIKGTFTTNTAGTWKVQAATSAGVIVLQAGSKFKVRRFAAGNVGSFV